MSDLAPLEKTEEQAGLEASGGGAAERSSLREIGLFFLRLGATAFGGPAAHIAVMEDEVVRRRQWLPREEFLDLLGATNLIPGPNSTEMVIHIGYRRGGWPGLFIAGAAFILPSTLIVGVIAWGYVRFGQLPEIEGVLYGVKPVVLAVILQALWRLGGSALKTRLLMGVACVAAVVNFLFGHELAVLFGTGLAVVVIRMAVSGKGMKGGVGLFGILPAIPFAAGAGGSGIAAVAVPFGLWPMFLFFVKVGSVLFGSGYVLLAFLRADLVDRWQWLTESQLLDAIAIGQVTPGPVFTAATFIGYLLAGAPGAAVATAGIFLPAFFFVAVSGPLVPRLRRSPTAGAFLDGLNAASLALMAVVTLQLGHAAFVDLPTIGLGAAGAFLLLRCRISSTWLIAGSAAIGILLFKTGVQGFGKF